MTKARMTFDSPSFQTAVQNVQTNANSSRVTNLNTANQRVVGAKSSTNGISNLSASDRESTSNFNSALSSNPYLNQLQSNNSRDFNEDTRRFNVTTGAKVTALADEQSTNRFQSSSQLEGVKYNADAGVKSTQITSDGNVKSTQIGADAQRYGADRNLEGNKYNADTNLAGTRLQTDASRYGADKGFQASIYNADRGVDQARIGADASRFNALLGASTSIFNSSQYRPTFNR